MPVATVLAFWATSVALIAVPGADWAFVLDAGLRRHVLPAVAGLVAGYLAITAVVAAGVGVLIAQSESALSALTVIGGVYLVWHGATTLVRLPAAPPTLSWPATGLPEVMSSDAEHRPARRTLARGIGVSGLNPKGLLIFLSLLPQFTTADATWPAAAQIGALGMVFVVTCALFYLLLGTIAGYSLAARPALAKNVSRLAGLAMAIVGALLIGQRLLG